MHLKIILIIKINKNLILDHLFFVLSKIHHEADMPEINTWAASWQNQQNGMWAQQRLRSAWASAQSDQSLRCPHQEILGP